MPKIQFNLSYVLFLIMAAVAFCVLAASQALPQWALIVGSLFFLGVSLALTARRTA